MTDCDFGKDVRSAQIAVCKFYDLSRYGRKVKTDFSPFIVVEYRFTFFYVSINTLLGSPRKLVCQCCGMPLEDGISAVKRTVFSMRSNINLEYVLPNGCKVKFLDDKTTYLANQLECEFGGERCFGIAGNMEFLLVYTYGQGGEAPELVIYKKR